MHDATAAIPPARILVAMTSAMPESLTQRWTFTQGTPVVDASWELTPEGLQVLTGDRMLEVAYLTSSTDIAGAIRLPGHRAVPADGSPPSFLWPADEGFHRQPGRSGYSLLSEDLCLRLQDRYRRCSLPSSVAGVTLSQILPAPPGVLL